MFTIGIIGRPNVGKSTLFNRIAGKRAAITDDRPGVTRDRIEIKTSWAGKHFRIVDTAGFDLKEDIIKKEMQRQVYKLLDLADLFILMTDGAEGVHPLDQIVVRMLFERGKPFVVAVNKIDSESRELLLHDFHSLGAGNILPISATHGRGVDDLLDLITKDAEYESEAEADDEIRIAVIGRPNVGKSSLINAWLGEERVIVTPIAGTTRDSIDTQFELNGEKYLLIDTAGIRKKSVMFKDPVEKIGYYRSMDAIERCHITVAVTDGADGFNERDIKVIADAWEAGKPVILAVNKWDLVAKDSNIANFYKKQVSEKLQFLSNPPLIFISAETGKNIFKIFDAAKELIAEYKKRVSTALVNDILETALSRHQPPVVHNRRLKFYYMTQVGIMPPQFVTFVNYPDAVHFSYQRFIVNIIRENFGFSGVPVKLYIRRRKNKNEQEVVVRGKAKRKI
ncbi:MAG: ribosome biogenesis GTPase Der [Deferribacteraceae bacterium]|jgi:GTP-binding protein|nr:ribosome biogenesis GTPase Der [Deferribacteraceae bacterium]